MHTSYKKNSIILFHWHRQNYSSSLCNHWHLLLPNQSGLKLSYKIDSLFQCHNHSCFASTCLHDIPCIYLLQHASAICLRSKYGHFCLVWVSLLLIGLTLFATASTNTTKCTIKLWVVLQLKVTPAFNPTYPNYMFLALEFCLKTWQPSWRA